MQLQTKFLLKELFNIWHEWDKYKNYYLHQLLPELMKNPLNGSEKEKDLIEKIKKTITLSELMNTIDDLEEIVDGNYSVNNIVDQIKCLISDGFFDDADKLYNQIKNLYINKFLPFEYKEEKEKFYKNTINQINYLLKSYKYTEAKNLYLKYNKLLENYNFDNAKNESLKKEILNELDILLQSRDFLKSDNYFNDNQKLPLVDEYENLKIDYIQQELKELSEKLGFFFDEEKATVLSVTGQNVLVRARAGSGKTTTVALKVRQLIKFYHAKPEEILVLAFNKKAAEEFEERINKYCQEKIADKTNSLTFHSLAYRLINPGEQLIFNDNQNDNEFVLGQQNEFIGRIYDKIFNNDRGILLTLLYNFFKSPAKERFLSDFNNKENFYLYRRNLQYVSLGGERVKSKAEKFIADFLFEHKIFINNQEVEYKYEKNLPGGKRRYKPDFSFWSLDQSKDIVLLAILEHFGITKKHLADKNYMSEKEEQNYFDEKKWKEDYCKQKKVLFLSTSIDDFDFLNTKNERLCFEKILRQRLEINGINLQKLNKSQIIEKMLKSKKNLKQLFKQIAQFINRAKKQLLSPIDIQKLAENQANNLSERSINFIKIARRVFEEYQNSLMAENKIDFDDLLIRAIKKIKETKGCCKIEIFSKEVAIKDIKYILIDEYQDFSLIFYKLIDAIKVINPEIKIFCVGDDWQAINSFAGSDLEYFANFKKYFVNSRKVSLLTNHRSFKDIVEYSNLVMSNMGDGGIPEKDKPRGEIYLCATPYVEWQKQQNSIDEYNNDKIYRDRTKLLSCFQNKEIEVSRYLKMIEIIVNENKNKEICFLFRTKDFYGIKIEKLRKEIKQCYPFNKIICSTVHSYKGKESEIVVIVDANRKNYPKIHPDNELMEILGVSLSKVIEEERHLFYVAITRAKERLYMLYDINLGYSDFIRKEWSYRTVSPEDPIKKYLFFTIRTTNLPPNWNASKARITQIAWSLYRNNIKVSSNNFIIKPEGFIIQTDVEKINGITTERAEKEGTSLRLALSEFQNSLEQTDFLITHNMSFNKTVIAEEFLRNNMLNDIEKKNQICTKEETTRFCKIPNPYDYNNYKWPKLSELYMKLFDKEINEKLNILDDVNTITECFWELKKRNIL